jgi:hypothetical protein
MQLHSTVKVRQLLRIHEIALMQLDFPSAPCTNSLMHYYSCLGYHASLISNLLSRTDRHRKRHTSPVRVQFHDNNCTLDLAIAVGIVIKKASEKTKKLERRAKMQSH